MDQRPWAATVCDAARMDMRFEAITLHAGDVDALRAFYERAGFAIDVDHAPDDHVRIVQATPPGSAASVIFGHGFPTPDVPVMGMYLVVTDIEAGRQVLVDRGIDVGEIFHIDEHGQQPGVHPTRARYGSMATIEDPSGNTWLLQEVPAG